MVKAFKFLDGFKNFILRGNVVDLAVGVVMGAAFGTIISALVKDLLTPLIAALVKAPDFSGLYFTINGSRFLYGDFINALVSFLLVSFAVYFFVIMPMNRLMTKLAKPQISKTKKCPECLSDIPVGAKRCSYCTQIV